MVPGGLPDYVKSVDCKRARVLYASGNSNAKAMVNGRDIVVPDPCRLESLKQSIVALGDLSSCNTLPAIKCKVLWPSREDEEGEYNSDLVPVGSGYLGIPDSVTREFRDLVIVAADHPLEIRESGRM